MMSASKLNEASFLSVCLTSDECTSETVNILLSVSNQISKHFVYWELIVICNFDCLDDHDVLLEELSNIRIISAGVGTDTYDKRVIAVNESIGDIVLLSTIEELHAIDFIAPVKIAVNHDCTVVVRTAQINLMNPVFKSLGTMAGFHVDTRTLLTMVLLRNQIGPLLRNSSAKLALRFPPRDLPTRFYEFKNKIEPIGKRKSVAHSIARKLGLIQLLLVSTAPKVLTFVSLLSLFIIFGAGIFACYVIFVWITFDVIQPGWITTSLLLSGTSILLGAITFGLSIALRKIIEMLTFEKGHAVVLERNKIDLYEKVFVRKNVEIPSDD